MLEYYVYCHRNPLTNEIFYIGKGKNQRAYNSQSRGKHWKNYVKKNGIPIVEILYKNLNEEQSLIIEKEMIDKLGRKDLGLGKLINETDGGDGISGLKHNDETKEKIKLSRIGKPSNNKGKTWKQKNKRPVGFIRGEYKTRKDKGKKFTSEIKDKMKEVKGDIDLNSLRTNKQTSPFNPVTIPLGDKDDLGHPPKIVM
jgi:hypothetical protein